MFYTVREMWLSNYRGTFLMNYIFAHILFLIPFEFVWLYYVSLYDSVHNVVCITYQSQICFLIKWYLKDALQVTTKPFLDFLHSIHWDETVI